MLVDLTKKKNKKEKKHLSMSVNGAIKYFTTETLTDQNP